MGELREGILEALVAHDPLDEASDADSDGAYAFEANELTTILSGTAADAATCAASVWTVLGGGRRSLVALTTLGAAIADVLVEHPYDEDLGDGDEEDEDDEDDDGLGLDEEDDEDEADDLDDVELADPVATAVLMAMITRDPYALGRREGAVDWHAAYAEHALDLVRHLRGSEVGPAVLRLEELRDVASLQPTCPTAPELELRVRLLRDDIVEIGSAAVYLRTADVERAAAELDADDPLAAGIHAVLDRHDPAPDAVPDGYADIAAGVADCLREADDADAPLCARVCLDRAAPLGQHRGGGRGGRRGRGRRRSSPSCSASTATRCASARPSSRRAARTWRSTRSGARCSRCSTRSTRSAPTAAARTTPTRRSTRPPCSASARRARSSARPRSGA